VYCTSPGTFSTSAWTTLILDAQNITDQIFVFQAVTQLTTGAYSIIVLKNGALQENVFWSIGTRATIGASSFFVGQIMAYTAATVSRDATLKGRVLTLSEIVRMLIMMLYLVFTMLLLVRAPHSVF
jgi:hypothetical protein